MKNYYKAVRIAKSYAGDWYRDIVHTAYLAYWNSNGKSLFDQQEGFIIWYIKNQYLNFYRTCYKDIRLKRRTGEVVPYDDVDVRDPLFELIRRYLVEPCGVQFIVLIKSENRCATRIHARLAYQVH